MYHNSISCVSCRPYASKEVTQPVEPGTNDQKVSLGKKKGKRKLSCIRQVRKYASKTFSLRCYVNDLLHTITAAVAETQEHFFFSTAHYTVLATHHPKFHIFYFNLIVQFLSISPCNIHQLFQQNDG